MTKGMSVTSKGSSGDTGYAYTICITRGIPPASVLLKSRVVSILLSIDKVSTCNVDQKTQNCRQKFPFFHRFC